MPSDPARWDKYIRICQMAFAKYAEPDNPALIYTHRDGLPTRYQRVCDFAFDYFLRRQPVTKYTAEFIGCRVGASGIQYAITDTFDCEPSDLFRLLYDKYEHIRLLTFKVEGRLLSDKEMDQIYQSTNWSKQDAESQAIPSNESTGAIDSEVAQDA